MTDELKSYRVWVDGRKKETLTYVQATSSFIARKSVADSNNFPVTDCVAQRAANANRKDDE